VILCVLLAGFELPFLFCEDEMNKRFSNYSKQKKPLAPLRVLVAASTDAGVTTRLKPKQARQLTLASLSFLAARIAGF